MANLPISIALELYDRTLPLIDGSVVPVGTDPTVMVIPEGPRHVRMVENLEFDVCELSLGFYVRALEQGLPITAIPVFPRRLFMHQRIYVNANAGINTPKDLEGKRMGQPAFQNTSAVTTRADLERDYGVNVKEIIWMPRSAGPVAFEAPPGFKIEMMERGKDPVEELVAGHIDALIHLTPPAAFVAGNPAIRRLFPDTRAEEQAYFKRHGYFPIHHLIAVRSELLEANPWLAMNLVDAFNEAKRRSRHYYDEACYTSLVWARPAIEDEQSFFGGADPWPYGLAANRPNLQNFLDLEHEQGLIQRPMKVEELFFPSTLKT